MNKPQLPVVTAGWLSSFRHDLLASIVVFLVALPLCMGIAIASGVPPERAAAASARIGLLTIILTVLWKPLVPRQLKVIPAPLVAVTVATAVTVFLQLPVKQVAVPDNLLDAVQLPAWDALRGYADWQTFLLAGLAMA